MLAKFEQTSIVQTIRNFELFDQKKKKNNRVFKNHIWQTADAILEDVPVAETIV